MKSRLRIVLKLMDSSDFSEQPQATKNLVSLWKDIKQILRYAQNDKARIFFSNLLKGAGRERITGES